MTRARNVTTIFMVLSIFLCSPAFAGEMSEMKEAMQKIQKELYALRHEVKELKAEKTPGLIGSKSPKNLIDRVGNLESTVQTLQEERVSFVTEIQQISSPYKPVETGDIIQRVEKLEQSVKTIEEIRAQTPPPQPLPQPESGGAMTQRMEYVEDSIRSIEEERASFLEEMGRKVDVNYYAAAEYRDLSNDISEFDGRHLELLLNVRMNDRIRSFAQIRFFRIPRSLTTDVLQAWMQYEIAEWIKFRAGAALTVPFGRYNSVDNADHLQELTSLPAFANGVVPFPWSDSGAGFNGSIPIGERLNWSLSDFSVDYEIVAINGLSGAITDTDQLRNARIRSTTVGVTDVNNDKAVVTRLSVHPFIGLDLGFSSYFGGLDKADHTLYGQDVDFKYTHGSFDILGEFAHFQIGPEVGPQLSTVTFTPSTSQVTPETLAGGQLEARYHFWPKWLNGTFLAGKFDSPKLTSTVRYDWARVADDSDATGTDLVNKEQHWTFGLNYRPVPTWVFKVEYILSDGTGEPISFTGNDGEGVVMSVAAAF